MHLLLDIDDRWLAKTLTQISVHWHSWQTWLILMHWPQKKFHFFSVSNGPTSILSDIVITLWKSHEIIFVGYFWKITNTCERCFWDVSETSQDILFETCSRRLKDVTQNTSFFEMLLRRLKDVKKKNISFEMFLRSLWNISFNGDLIETSQRQLVPAGIKHLSPILVHCCQIFIMHDCLLDYMHLLECLL